MILTQSNLPSCPAVLQLAGFAHNQHCPCHSLSSSGLFRLSRLTTPHRVIVNTSPRRGCSLPEKPTQSPSGAESGLGPWVFLQVSAQGHESECPCRSQGNGVWCHQATALALGPPDSSQGWEDQHGRLFPEQVPLTGRGESRGAQSRRLCPGPLSLLQQTPASLSSTAVDTRPRVGRRWEPNNRNVTGFRKWKLPAREHS